MHELRQLLGAQVMREEIATHQIESAVAERQGQRIADNAMSSRGKMRPLPVEQRHIERDPAPR